MVVSSFLEAPCETMNDKITCRNSIFWEKGFVAFQAAINAGIIEVSTKLTETRCIVHWILIGGSMDCLIL